MKKIVSLAVCLFLCTFIVHAEEVRTWTSGKFKTEAEFVRVSDDGKTVTLKKTTGKEIAVALDKLSKADRGYVAKRKSVAPPPMAPEKESMVQQVAPEVLAKRTSLLEKINHVNEEKVRLGRLLHEPNPEEKIIVKLSDKEKADVAQCAVLVEKALERELRNLDLEEMLHKLRYYKSDGRGSYRHPSGNVTWNSSDKYSSLSATTTYETINIDTYIACWAFYDTLDAKRDWPMIVPLFPECNKLAGGIHEEKEKTRITWQTQVDEKQRALSEMLDMFQQKTVVSEAVAQRKAALLKKIDILNDPNKDQKLIVKLSDEEKDGVVQCVMLGEKALGQELSEDKLTLMLFRMDYYKRKGRNEPYGGVIWLSSDGSKGSYGSSPTTKIDAYIACWAFFDAHYVDKEEVWAVIAPLFPECNKLAGGIHDDKEKERKDWQILEDRKKKLIQEIKDMRY